VGCIELPHHLHRCENPYHLFRVYTGVIDLAHIRFDISNCNWPASGCPLPTTEVDTEATRHRRDQYVRGPFRLTEFCTASRLPGKALAVWLLLHHRVRVTGDSEVALPSGLLEQAGIDRNAKQRALRDLERVGLIRVRRERGRTARVSIVRLD
jgi:hypothetical protein